MAKDLLPYGGGAGGKLRRGRRYGLAKTPYDRPLTGRHLRNIAAASETNTNRSWLSKLVSPASRLIADSASRLFSSVFSRRATSYSSSSFSSSDDDDGDDDDDDHSSEEEEEGGEEEEAVNNGIVAEANKQGRGLSQANTQKSENKLTEIEQLLAEKTFTRDEFIHLTELLQSRTIDSSSGSKEHEEQARAEQYGGDDHRNAVFAEAQRWREERKKAREESMNGGWDRLLCGSMSSPAMLPEVSNNSGSSPVDIAKAYMGARPIWASSSALALQSETYQDGRIQDQLNSLSLIPRTKEGWSVGNAQLEDRYRTPPPARTWSRIQNSTHTPYSRPVHPRIPYYRFIQAQDSVQMMKRRNSVVDDGWASIGPIRRIHQKPMGMISSFSPAFEGFDSSATKSSPPVPLVSPRLQADQKAFSFGKQCADMQKHNYACSPFQGREDASKVCAVPPQSSATSWKILEHLNRTTHSPKENSAEAQLAVARDKSPSQLNGDSDIEHRKYKDNGKTPLSGSTVAPLEKPALSGIGDATLWKSQAIFVRSDAKQAALSGSSVLEEKSQVSQMNVLEDSWGPNDEVHGSRKAEISMEKEIEVSKHMSIATDGALHLKTCDPIPTFKFGSGNASNDPVFSFSASGTTYVDTSMPKFDFKFESKPELLFSTAVEAAVAAAAASTSTPQIVMGSKAINVTSKHAPQELGMTQKSPAVFSNFGTDQRFQKFGNGLNQDTSKFLHTTVSGHLTASSSMFGSTGAAASSFAPASSMCSSASLQSISSSASSTSLFTRSSSISFWNTNSTSPSTPLFSSGASLVSLGLRKHSGFSSTSTPSFGLSNSALDTSTIAHFSAGSTALFGSCPTPSSGKTASATFGTSRFVSPAGFGLSATATPSFGCGSSSSLVLGSSTSPPSFSLGSNSSIVCSSGPPFSNSATPLGSGSSPSFGFWTGSLFGSGSSTFSGNSPAFGLGSTSSCSLAQPVGATIIKSASQSVASMFGYGLGSASLSSTEFAKTESTTANNGSSVVGDSVGVSIGTVLTFNSATGASSSPVIPASASSQMAQKSVFGSTSSTPPISTLTFGPAPTVSAPVDGITNDQMSMKDGMTDDATQLSSPRPSVFDRQPTSPASAALVLGSESSAASTASQTSTPISHSFASGSQSAVASVGIEGSGRGENSLGARGEKSSRRIIRPKRDKTRKK